MNSESTNFAFFNGTFSQSPIVYIFGDLKDSIISILQRVLGFRTYLYLFSVFKILTLKMDDKEGDFFTFLKLIKPSDTVLDLGANIGIMTYYLSKKVKNGHVFAFEPVPENVITLQRIIKRFQLSNVKLMEVALGADSGELEMVMPEFQSARKQGLSHVVHPTIPDFNEGKKYTVPVKRLDEISHFKEQPIHAIKLDVENFEYFVLKGGSEIIQKCLPIVYMELWDNENRYKCMDLMSEWGYKVHVVINKSLVEWDKNVHQQQNFIFLPQ